jgi:hypothetical protein
MSINDATPQEWDEVSGPVRVVKRTALPEPPPVTVDDVDHPVHYNNGKVECIEAIEAMLSPTEFEGYVRGNIIKYVWRFKYKDGVKDLKKAKWYLERLISTLDSSEK